MRNVLVSLFVYFFGLLAYIACDVIVSGYFPPERIAEWAEVRSLIGILGVLCLAGLGDLFIRSPWSSSLLLKCVYIQVPIAAILAGYIVHRLGFLDSFYHAAGIALSSAFLIVMYQYFRSVNYRVIAQIVQQSWKVVILIVILASLIGEYDEIDLSSVVVFVMIIIAGAAAALVLAYPPVKMHVQNPDSLREIYRIGFRIMATSLFLALSIYAEQLLIQRISDDQTSAFYFAHATYFVFPASAINGYIGFLIGPWSRDNRVLYIDLLTANWFRILVVIIVCAIGIHYIGLAAWAITKPSVGSPSLGLRAIFFLVTIAAALYNIPSAYNGNFGSPRNHDMLILGQLISFVSGVAVFSVLFFGFQVRAITSVAIGSLVNLILRTYTAFLITRSIHRYRSENSFG